ncbi:MAG: DEAD/DEAH box helicase family protein [Candidatus Gastranaerophilales bacterium]|nr:DEAD/DEAH box helicase family protein [Candidatus Gastranaerophilales bacterium]
MRIIDNINCILKDDLLEVIRPKSKVSIASACFSIYAYQELKTQLENIDELRFIFTSPAFVKEKTSKAKREFYIPRISREKSLYGTEYEVKLRNELTQRAIAKECAEWIKQKVRFKSNITNEQMSGFINVESDDAYTYQPVNGFTTTDIGCEKGNTLSNIVVRIENPQSQTYLKTFEAIWNDKNKLQDVTDQIVSSISDVYKENSGEFIYFITLYNIFNEFLQNISEDNLPNEATGYKDSVIWNKLFDFQKDACLAIINKLETYNGCILADSVGLGKTFTALSVVKYYENRNKSVLVLCPKKLSNNWVMYKSNYKNNPLAADRLRYDVLYHTDLSRDKGASNGIDLSLINWSNYDLVVIDESHNFRNGGDVRDDKENRYLRLMNRVIRQGVQTKVLMLSATPVNNRFNDLKNQLQLAYEGDTRKIDSKLNTKKPINVIFRQAQQAFNDWSNLPADERTTECLLNMLDFDFFELLDSVTIARSRKHIEKYYDTANIGKFPTRLPVISVRPAITNNQNLINYNQIYEYISSLNLCIYMPSLFIFPSKEDKYYDLDAKQANIKASKIGQHGREEGIRRLMGINLLKRLESSVYSFKLTLIRVQALIASTLDKIEEFKNNSLESNIEVDDYTEIENEFDDDDLNTNIFLTGNKFKIDFNDMDCLSWEEKLQADLQILNNLIFEIDNITPEEDAKLQRLLELIKNKIEKPINKDNKKLIVFSAFADTAEYLYKYVSEYVKVNFGLETAMVTGSRDGVTTLSKIKTDLNTVLTYFSPMSKDKNLIFPDDDRKIDVLIATDCISEGQNLQDCDYLVNYDIHWNPVRIIQRFGRIDRIGSKNNFIQLVNFWPDLNLDEYINLKSRVETRMKVTVMTSTGTGADNVLDVNEKEDLEYRKRQLEKLQTEVVDIEEMNSGINIMDLGLNEFRLDLLAYMKENPDLETSPYGLHAVVKSDENLKSGVIYILKNVTDEINIDNKNRLHPFYMVYIADDGEVLCNYLQPKILLDLMRKYGKKNPTPDEKLCREFNIETEDGRKMGKYSMLLEEAIASIIDVKEETDFESLFSAGESSYMKNTISGLDDFELICFLVVK